MKKAVRKRLTWLGWISFLIGLCLVIIRLMSDRYVVDLLIFSNILIPFVIAGASFMTFFMSFVNKDKATKVYGGFICPIFLVMVIFTMFFILPFDQSIVLETHGPGSAKIVDGSFWFNPFVDNAFDYSYDIYGHAVQDSIIVRYDYDGTLLDFHKGYRGQPDQFDSLATRLITKIINDATKECLGQPRIEQLYYLFHDLPVKLPKPIRFDGQINVALYGSMYGPVVDEP